MELVTFALAMAAGQLTPGPDMLLILKNTLNHGLPSGLATIAGICTGIVIHVSLVFTGLGAVLIASPGVFRVVQLLGAGYLLWIAGKLLLALRARPAVPGAVSDGSGEFSPSKGASFREGFLTNITNVKVIILFSSILAPLAVGPSGLRVSFGVIIILEAALIWPVFAWLMLRPPLRRAFFRFQKTLNLLFALLIAGFAARLLLAF